MKKSMLYLLFTATVSAVITDLPNTNSTEISIERVDKHEQLSTTGGVEYITEIPPSESSLNDSAVIQNNTIKHEYFMSCLAVQLFPGEYELFSNDTVYVEAYNKTFNSSFFMLENELLTICSPHYDPDVENDQSVQKFPRTLLYITRLGLGISIVCLSLHLIAFCMVPDLRNLPGWNLASLCLAVLLADGFFLVAHMEAMEQTGVPCVMAAVLLQFFYLASFLWSSTMAFDLFWSLLKATGKLRLRTTRFSWKRFSIYCLYSWGISLLFVIAALLLDNIHGVPDEYKPSFGTDICWFRQRKPLLILFVAPVFSIIGSNLILFGLSAYTIFSNRMKTTEEMHRSVLRKNCVTYSRLAIIMGMDWIVGVIASAANVNWLWYLFVLINTLQGLFIFLAFTCTAKVKNCIREKVSIIPKRFSIATSSPTFMSYYNYGSSVEKDLHCIPNNGKTENL